MLSYTQAGESYILALSVAFQTLIVLEDLLGIGTLRARKRETILVLRAIVVAFSVLVETTKARVKIWYGLANDRQTGYQYE